MTSIPQTLKSRTLRVAKASAARCDDRRDLTIDLGDRLAGLAPTDGYSRIGHRRIAVEAEDPAGELVRKDRVGGGDQVVAATSCGRRARP
jgi:hypothetical protein